ncbi:hypothetical protein BRSPCE3_27230 [Bradyrhizobium sp. Ce-3]|nr:hypothetical protein BRSPCE3_27230 [Bradyrhizobium sp. Ce-3]
MPQFEPRLDILPVAPQEKFGDCLWLRLPDLLTSTY